jgi:hypothetical protein
VHLLSFQPPHRLRVVASCSHQIVDRRLMTNWRPLQPKARQTVPRLSYRPKTKTQGAETRDLLPVREGQDCRLPERLPLNRCWHSWALATRTIVARRHSNSTESKARHRSHLQIGQPTSQQLHLVPRFARVEGAHAVSAPTLPAKADVATGSPTLEPFVELAPHRALVVAHGGPDLERSPNHHY